MQLFWDTEKKGTFLRNQNKRVCGWLTTHREGFCTTGQNYWKKRRLCWPATKGTNKPDQGGGCPCASCGHPKASGQKSRSAASDREPAEGRCWKLFTRLFIEGHLQDAGWGTQRGIGHGSCPQGTAILVVERGTEISGGVWEAPWKRSGFITCLVSKFTKQYPRGCPSKAPDLWKRKSNCFTVPNFWRSLRRWYLQRKRSPWAHSADRDSASASSAR